MTKQDKAQAEQERNRQQIMEVRAWLDGEKVQATLDKACAGTMTPERLLRVALMAFHRNPQLALCTRDSILLSLLEAAALSLAPTGVIGHAYLVPYRNHDTGDRECQLQVGYKGLVTLAMRHPDVLAVSAKAVREGDDFEYREGSAPFIHHIPNLDELDPNPETITHLYSRAWLRDAPHPVVQVMSRAQVEAIRTRSKNGDSRYSPWKTDWEPMALKTVTRRLVNWDLPMEVEAMGAIAKDDAVEYGDGATQLAAYVAMKGLPTPDPIRDAESKVPEAKTKSDRLGQTLRRNREQAEAAATNGGTPE